MDVAFLADPTMFGVLKVVGIGIAFLIAIGFIPGLVIGWFVGKAT